MFFADLNDTWAMKLPASAPRQPVSALRTFQRNGVKLFCKECDSVRGIATVSGAQELEASTLYDLTLECGHSRTHTQNVQRSDEAKRRIRKDDDSGPTNSELEIESGGEKRLDEGQELPSWIV